MNEHDLRNGISERALSVRDILSQAYNFSVMPFRDDEVEGLPGWAKSARYDVEARVDPDDAEAFHTLSNISTSDLIAAFAARQSTGQMLMEQAMLADRFHLKVHWEMRLRPVAVLTVAKGGPHLAPAADPKVHTMYFSEGKLTGKGAPVSFMASLFAVPADRHVVDRTGIKGDYDFELKFAPPNHPGESDQPDFYRALQEQLGLKLESGKELIPVLVIDHMEQPTAN